MFYKHLHDPSCDLFMHGEEAPQSKEAQLQAALDAERERVRQNLLTIMDLQAQVKDRDAMILQMGGKAAVLAKESMAVKAQLRQVEGERNTAWHRVDELEAREIDVEILQGDNARLLAAIDEGLTGTAINLAVRTVEEMYADNAALRLKVQELEEQLRLANCDQVNTENDLNDVTSQLATIQAQLQQVETDRQALRQLVEVHTKQLTELTIIPIGCSREQELRWTQSIKDLRATLAAQDVGKEVRNGL